MSANEAVIAMAEHYFKNVDDLSLAPALASSTAREVATLEQQEAALKEAAPAVLEGVRAAADTALSQLNDLEAQRSRIEKDITTKLAEFAQVRQQIEPACSRLHRLEVAELVVQTLVDTERLTQQVERALQAAEAAASTSQAAGRSADATQALLRLHVLHLCVRQQVVDSSGGPGGGGGDSGAADDGEVVSALLVLVEEKLGKVIPRLRAPMEQRLTNALSAVGWPSKVKEELVTSKPIANSKGRRAYASEAARELHAAMCDLLLLQHAHSELPAAAGEESREAGEAGEAGGSLWALDALAAPVLVRFRFHFETRRETNRRDKPEWVYTHCGNLLKLHHRFLTEQVGPMLLSPLGLLQGAWAKEASALADRESYKRFVVSHCPRGAYLALAGKLCEAMAGKLGRELPSLMKTPTLFNHTLNETLSFERELRQGLEVCVLQGGRGGRRRVWCPAGPRRFVGAWDLGAAQGGTMWARC